jgi:hypothetical protein
VKQPAPFFGLYGPQDLLSKLQHDYKRLTKKPDDSYAAFDFFATAVHMHEWMTRYGAKWTAPTEPKMKAIYEICGDLGNGAKHFVRKDKVRKGLEVKPRTFAPNDVGALVIHLSDSDAALFGMATVTVLQLAASVLHYWEVDMHNRRFPLSMI